LIALDSSSFSRFLDGTLERDTELVASALREGTAVIAGVVLTELLSRPVLSAESQSIILRVPVLTITAGYWMRAASLRRDTRALGNRANVADVLIAQCCIDLDIPLISYDRDFRHFVKAGLKLA
jgi:predicted nucleic acid-binding protein